MQNSKQYYNDYLKKINFDERKAKRTILTLSDQIKKLFKSVKKQTI